MADKSFGVKEIELIGASGTPTIESPNNLEIKAVNVAISTDITVGGMVSLGAGTSISSPGTNVLTFGTNSTEKVRIESDGDIKFGNQTSSVANNSTALVHIDAGREYWNGTAGDYRALKHRMYYVNTDDAYGMGVSNGLLEIQSQGNIGFFAGSAGATSGRRAQRLRINSSGNVSITNGNLVFSTSGTGIDFSATGDASGMTSELLDDYEEGTWTPTIRLDGGTANGTTLTPESTSYKGRYVKIGDMVFVEAYVRYNLSTLTGTWTTTAIQGLPYTQGNQNSQQYTGVHIGYLSGFYSGFPTTGNAFPAGYVRTGQSDLILTINDPNGSETTISNSVLSSSASAGIMFSTYYRDSASG